MKISEITRPEEIENAEPLLTRAGYQDLQHSVGHTRGTFARVYSKPDKNYVVKVFQQEDYAYRRYLNLITSVRNPHFPVLRGKPMRVSNFIYGVRLELLQPFMMAYNHERLTMDQYLKGLQDLERYDDHPSSIEYSKNQVAKATAELRPEMKQALDLIFQHCIQGQPKTIVDLHPHNVMMRGDTIVIIDPIAYGRESDTTPRLPDFDKWPAYRQNQPAPMPAWIGYQ